VLHNVGYVNTFPIKTKEQYILERTSMPKPKSELTLAREGKVGKLSIIGDIGWQFFGMSHESFKSQLKALGKLNVLEVEINSLGGVVTDGIGIMNDLRYLDADVHVYINGIAASIASVIAMGADKLFIPTNSLMMVHKPLNVLFGNADDMRKMADDLDTFESAIVASYMRHFTGTEDEIRSLMTEETYMTASDVSDRFNNVVIMHSDDQMAATADPVAVLGNIEDFDEDYRECILDKTIKGVKNIVKKGTTTKEVDMPLTQEEKQEIVADTTASVVAALDKREADAKAKAEADAAAATAGQKPEAKVEVPFEGDMTKPEDVQAHAEKVALAELTAAADMTTSAGVQAHLKALEDLKGTQGAPPASAQAADTTVAGKSEASTKAAQDETINRMAPPK
jgi:ATP-dependent Clp protease protease subunit